MTPFAMMMYRNDTALVNVGIHSQGHLLLDPPRPGVALTVYPRLFSCCLLLLFNPKFIAILSMK